MAEYPQSIKIYANLNSTWTDITSDVYAPDKITGYWGMRDNRELTRVADVGRMNFTLNNDAGLYAPNLGTALAGWGKGTQIKLVIKYRDRDHIKFFGTVDSLRITGGALGVRRAYVTVKDWMDFAAKYPLVNPGYQTNKRANEALTTIIAGMPIQPQDTTFGTGVETFLTVFDAVTTKTRAQSEFNKLALSEMGYVYLRKDFATGENLKFDPRTVRKGTDTPTTYSVPGADSGFFIMQDGSYFVQQDGTSKFKLNPAEDLTLDIDNNMQDVGVDYGNNIINRMSVHAYPRKVDTSNQVLFSAGFPIQIGAGETIEFRGAYFDPSGSAIVNADTDNMVTPVAGTDYIMNTASDGSGSVVTSDLTVVAVYGSEGVTYTLTNVNGATCYITTLQARGIGIRTYTTLESTAEDQDSIDAYGYHSENLHQMYQQNTQLGKEESGRIIANEKYPRTVLSSVSLNANKSADLLYGFLVYDIGDLVPIREDISGIDSNYYIHQVAFSIDAALQGSGVIDYTWIVKEARSIASGYYAPLALEPGATTMAGQSNHINFGSLNYLQNLPEQTISFWAYVSDEGFLLSAGDADSGKVWYVYLTDNAAVLAYNQYMGQWSVTTGVASGGSTYHHFMITKSTVVVDTPPIIYVSGVSKTIGVDAVQSAILDETGYNLKIGGTKFSGFQQYLSFAGRVKDLRIYNRILSASEALGITNEGAYGSGYLDGCLFQAPVTSANDLTYYTDRTMVSTDRVLDSAYGVSGTPLWGSPNGNAPITRLP